MSPEQCLGEGELDARADVFSLGVILYELLTGKTPFDGANAPAIIYATMTRDPVPARRQDAGCPVMLEDLCLRMLAKDRAQRPATAEEVAEEVEAFLEGAKEKSRRHAEAERLAGEARAHAERHFALGAEQD